jgi:hypothetical protein
MVELLLKHYEVSALRRLCIQDSLLELLQCVHHFQKVPLPQEERIVLEFSLFYGG